MTIALLLMKKEGFNEPSLWYENLHMNRAPYYEPTKNS